MTGHKIIDQYTYLPVSRQRKWQLRHPDAAKQIKSRYIRSPKGRATQARADHKYVAAHREEMNEYHRAYRARNPEKMRAYWRTYKQRRAAEQLKEAA
jgi:hypothetical protein